MAKHSLEDMSLRDLVKNSERMTQELIDHLEQNFLPQVEELRQLVKSQGNIADLTVRQQADKVLSSENYTAELFEKLNKHLGAITAGVTKVIHQDVEVITPKKSSVPKKTPAAKKKSSET